MSAPANSNEDIELEEGEIADDSNDGGSLTNGDNDVDDSASSPPPSSSAPSSSSSPSSSSPAPSSDSKDQSSSKSSSRIGSHQSSSSRNNSIFDKYQVDRLNSARRLSEDRYRIRDREKENPSEKAAKLISMRTRLLEARSREIELKFQKNKLKSSPPPPILSPNSDQKNIKMTVAKPSISYSENPNPPPFVESIAVPDEDEKEVESGTEIGKEKEKKKIKSKQKHEGKEKKQKKKSKKRKKKLSSKKRKKSKSSSSAKKLAIEPKPETPPELDLPLGNNKASVDHQGPRTPPDNHVMTLDDEQIEWPSHLIRTTLTQPSITHSVNPDSVADPTNQDTRRVSKRRKSTLTSPTERKRYKIDGKSMSISSPLRKNASPLTIKTDDDQSARKYSYPRPNEIDLNFDYRWYYNYFVNSLEMDHNQAQHQACFAIISAGSYEQETLDRWLISRGYSRQSSPICDGQKPPATPTIEEVITSRYESRHDHSIKMEDVNDSEKQESSSAEDVTNTNDENGEDIEKPCEKTEGSISLRPLKPKITTLKSQREIVLPNGQVLPPGTIQKIVHPYPKLGSELLGPYFDFY